MHDDAMARLRAANPVAQAAAVLPAGDVIAGWGDRASAALAGDDPVAVELARGIGTGRRAGTGRNVAAPRPRSRWRSSALSIGVALIVGTGSAAAALAAFTGSPIPHGGDDPNAIHPVAGTTHLSSARAVDPDGGPPWALRLGAAPGGLQCWGVGQVEGGELGLVGLDGRFRVMAPAGADDCGVPPTAQSATVQTRTFLGRTKQLAVTVVYGVRGSGLGGVRVRYADGAVATLPVGEDGGFLVARRGTLTQQHPRIEIDNPKGAPVVVDFGLHAKRATATHPLVPSEAVR